MAKKKNKPKAPPRPPAGSYDPILNSQARASKRGLGDLTRDIETQRERGAEDFNSQYGLLTTGRDRTLADILTGQQRQQADIQTSLNDLDFNYARLGNQQMERARASGVTSQGLLAKSDAVRHANRNRDQQPLLTAYARVGEDANLARTRANEDFTTRSGLLQTDYDRTYGEFGDLTKQLTRAGRENTIFQQDIGEQRAYQAAQTGWKAPKPKRQLGRGRAKPVGGNRGAGVGSVYA